MVIWKRDLDCPVSTEPEDRQRCIQNLASVVEPILDMICEATGWKASLIAGGPVPSQDGRLSVLSIHSGTTNGDVAMNFGRIENVRYYKYLVPMYSSFLRKCYPVAECQLRALAADDDNDEFDNMGDLEDDARQNMMFDVLHMPSLSPPQPRSPSTTPSPSPSRRNTPSPSRAISLSPSFRNSPPIPQASSPPPPPSPHLPTTLSPPSGK